MRPSVAQPPRSGDAYPFVGNVGNIADAVVDLRVGFKHTSHKLPLHVHSLEDLTGPDPQTLVAPNIVIRDANNATVVNTNTLDPPNTATWGSRYTIFWWPDSELPIYLIRDDVTSATLPTTINPDNVTIDIRASVVVVPGVNKIEVYSATGDQLAELNNQDLLRWRRSYNSEVDSRLPPQRTQSGARLVSTMTLNMAPGDGLGVFDDCELGGTPDGAPLPYKSVYDEVYLTVHDNRDPYEQDVYINPVNQPEGAVRSFDSATPDAIGNVNISSDRCFRVEPRLIISSSTAAIVPGEIYLSDDCVACCDCEDFLRVYKAILRLKRRYESLAARVAALLISYEQLRQNLESKLGCQYTLLRIAATPIGDCFIGVAVAICNPSDEKIDNAVVEVRVEDEEGNPVNINSSNAFGWLLRNNKPIDLVGIDNTSGGRIRINFGCIEPNETKSATLRIQVDTAGTLKICAAIVTWEPGESELEQPGTVCTTVNAYCDPEEEE